MSFDRIARFYGPMETWFAGKCMRRCREAFLDDIPAPREVLMIGEGHGRFLATFLRKFPAASVTVVDASAVMLEISKRAMPGGADVTFVHGRIEDWEAERRFDLIVTNFLLDCIPGDRLGPVIGKISSSAKPGADWLVAEFHQPEGGLAKWRSRFIVGLLYWFFGKFAGVEVRKLHPRDRFLVDEGFVLRKEAFFSWSLLKSEWWSRDC